jgi:thermostable 8-oxoguanine DNA glycosylase
LKQKQLEFTTVINEAFAQYERKIVAYMAAHKLEYEMYANAITPSAYSNAEIFSRVAFAILSANSPFEDSVKALNIAVKAFEQGANVKASDLVYYKQVPAKARYLNKLARMNLSTLLRESEETWHGYRLRLKRTVKGLGLAKASFAACLLYPLTADVACVDTWIQKVFLGHTGFKTLGIRDYTLVESKIRTYGACFGISTFLAQWLIWDHARGTSNAHAIFPGSHK